MRHAPLPAALFVKNRRRLRALLPPNSMAILNANDILPANADSTLRLVPNSDLFYLSGIEQEESILLIYPDAADEKHREILFVREAKPELETWEGHKLTKDEAKKISGLDRIQTLDAFPAILHRLMTQAEQVFLNSNEHPRSVIVVETRDARFAADLRRRYPLHNFQRLARLMHQLRVVKSAEEIDVMKRAIEITRRGFERVAKFVKPGVNEAEVEAEFAHEFIRNRATFAYTPIIASGKNSNVLHYIANDQPCRAGDLLLLDVASNYANYNSDLTRTIPVSGKFTRRQKEVYRSVLSVVNALTDAAIPGVLWKDWQKKAEELIEQELLKLGLLRPRDIKKQDPDHPALKKYFMHGVGHPLGLDVHDLGYMTEPFAPGWILTVEPGIYIPAEGFGVRLENNILVTENGAKNLMADIPIEPEDIEALMKK